jgi:metal-responsive CopG/Arc/MetJ family transcriptional regulator
MKTAISFPYSLYKAAEETAKSMGLPRSQLFAKALEEFISRYRKENITKKYNEIYSDNMGADLNQIDSVSIDNLRKLTKNDTW